MLLHLKKYSSDQLKHPNGWELSFFKMKMEIKKSSNDFKNNLLEGHSEV